VAQDEAGRDYLGRTWKNLRKNKEILERNARGINTSNGIQLR
jgi:hypothetical protein